MLKSNICTWRFKLLFNDTVIYIQISFEGKLHEHDSSISLTAFKSRLILCIKLSQVHWCLYVYWYIQIFYTYFTRSWLRKRLDLESMKVQQSESIFINTYMYKEILVEHWFPAFLKPGQYLSSSINRELRNFLFQNNSDT